MDRKALIDFLVTNSDSWKLQGDREVLNTFSDEKLRALKAAEDGNQRAIAVANSAANGFKDASGREVRVNPETGRWEQRVTANAPRLVKKNDDEEGEVVSNPASHIIEEEEEELDPDGRLLEPVMTRKNRARMAGDTRNQARRPQTPDEWFRSAPAEVQNMVASARQLEQREKDKLIAELLVNVAEGDRHAHRDRLNRRSLEDLHNDLALVPKLSPTGDEQRANLPTHRRGATTRNSRDQDMLEMPTINWQEMDGKRKGKSDRTVADEDRGVSNSDVGDYSQADMTEEEVLSKLPPQMRQRVQNASIIENRERTKIIDDLVANVNDEDQERRLRGRLAGKSLEELRDMQVLLPPRKQVTNYFGAAAPAANAAANASHLTDVDDVLLPPTMNWADASARGS